MATVFTPRQYIANATLSESERRLASQRVGFMPAWLIPAGLVCAFGVWFSWAVLVVQLRQLEPGIALSEQFSLLALTGLSAMCLRLTLGFMMRPGTEPLVLSGSLAMLTVAALGLYQFVGTTAPTFRTLQILALLAGTGGGCFSALINHSRTGDTDLSGLRAEIASGVGHLGIVASLLMLPLMVTFALPGQEPGQLLTGSSHFLGRVDAGHSLWLGWVGLFWGLASGFALVLSLPCLWRIRRKAWLDLGQFAAALVMGLGLAVLGAWWLLPRDLGGLDVMSPELALMAMIVLTLAAIRLWPWQGHSGVSFRIFANKHTWTMSLFWVMSLGSFLGFAMVLPATLTDLFAAPDALSGPEYPGIFLYAWMLPLSGVLVRPLGVWCARRWGGARVAQVCMGALVAGALAVAYVSNQVQAAGYSPPYFPATILAFLVIFVAASMAHAALISALPKLFPAAQQRSVGIWLTAISALGVVYIPLVVGQYLERGEAAQAMVGFALFYGLCFVLNGWLYLGRLPAFRKAATPL